MLSESDFDALVYEALIERLTNQTYVPVSRVMRKGSGLGAVRASLRIAVNEIASMHSDSGVCFFVSMDNDRAPHVASGRCAVRSGTSSIVWIR